MSAGKGDCWKRLAGTVAIRVQSTSTVALPDGACREASYLRAKPSFMIVYTLDTDIANLPWMPPTVAGMTK